MKLDLYTWVEHVLRESDRHSIDGFSSFEFWQSDGLWNGPTLLIVYCQVWNKYLCRVGFTGI